MKKIFFSLIIILSVNVLTAQNANYTIKKIGGKEYYEYKVEPGEGFYSVSRKFGIDENEIKRINPSVKDGLKSGDILYIPKEYEIKEIKLSELSAGSTNQQNQAEVQDQASPQQAATQTVDFIEHRVAKQETLFGISRRYGISQDEIKRNNPDIEQLGLRTNMVLRIPYNTQTNTQTANDQAETRSQQIDPVQNSDHLKTHEVKAGETIYKISQMYGISQDDLKKYNPNLEREGLRSGSVLLIPQITANNQQSKNETLVDQVSPVQEAQEPAPNMKISFLTHKVKRQETLYSISQRYGISQDDIKRHNPDIEKKGLRNGMKLQIPYIVVEDGKIYENDENFIYHKVKAKETLYSIGRQYNINTKDIVKENPGSDQILPEGKILKIPRKDMKSQTAEIKDGEISIADLQRIFGQISSDTTIITSKQTIRIAFLLPMMLDGKRDLGIDRFVDFYCGALVAIQEAKKQGISFEIYTYDTEKSAEKINEILKNSELKTMNLIIGPAYSEQVSAVTAFAEYYKINTIIPFTSKINDIRKNPYIYQFNPSINVEVEFVADLLNDKYKNANIVFADLLEIKTDNTFSEELKKELTMHHRVFSTAKLIDPTSANLSTSLSKNRKNIIIFNSVRFNDVSPYLTVLESLSEEFEIVLYEQYSWQVRENKKNKAIWISPFDPKPNMALMIGFETEFNKLFNRKNNTNNPRYDILGYDLCKYFISIYNEYGKDFPSLITKYQQSGIQSNYKFVQISNKAGYMNRKLYSSER